MGIKNFATYEKAMNAAYKIVKNGDAPRMYIVKLKAGYGVSKSKLFGKAENVIDADDVMQSEKTVKRKTYARTQSAAEDYVFRDSQVTRKKPTKRLVNRRIKNLQAPEGVFPNPATRKTPKSRSILVDYQEKSGAWKTLAIFPATSLGAKNAIEYARAYHAKEPSYKIRVIE